MKTTLYSLLAAAACGMALGQTAYTTPVGYTTTTISQAFAPGSPKNNIIAPALQNSASYSGQVASVAGDVITLKNGANPPILPVGAFNQLSSFSFVAFGYYIETADGYWAQIVSNDATSVTVEAGAGSNFSVDEAISIRRHRTIADIFGANNSAGLLASSEGDTTAADNVVLIDEVNGGNITVIASDAIGGTWITDAFEDAATLPVYPDQGLQVSRLGTSDLSLVVSGEVNVTGRQIGITTGVQLRPYVLPVDTTLTDLGLYTGNPATGVVGSSTGDTSEADIVGVNVNGVSFNYFYAEVDLGGGVGWYDDSLNFVGNDNLPAGAALIINRQNPVNTAPFVWVAPAP
jgi:hypothetical protein